MKNKELKILIDKVDEIDENGILFTENSISFSDNQTVPVYKTDFKDEELIGMAQVKYESNIKSLFAIIKFDDNYDINELVDKNLAPKYTVENEDFIVADGVTYVTKAKLISISVITNTHSLGLPAITKQDIQFNVLFGYN